MIKSQMGQIKGKRYSGLRAYRSLLRWNRWQKNRTSQRRAKTSHNSHHLIKVLWDPINKSSLPKMTGKYWTYRRRHNRGNQTILPKMTISNPKNRINNWIDQSNTRAYWRSPPSSNRTYRRSPSSPLVTDTLVKSKKKTGRSTKTKSNRSFK